jgi:hypothetical protein
MLGREDPQKTLLEVELWAGREIVPAGSFYGRFARIGPQLVSDDTFVRCYGTKGRPSVSPALLTKVLLLALHDGCSDRRAVEQMRMHLGWKLALGLPLDDPGCHPTTLTVFRARLVVHDLDRELFTEVVRKAVAAGLLARNAVQLVDSSAILGAGAVQDTYTLLRRRSPAWSEPASSSCPMSYAPGWNGTSTLRNRRSTGTTLTPGGKSWAGWSPMREPLWQRFQLPLRGRTTKTPDGCSFPEPCSNRCWTKMWRPGRMANPSSNRA